MKLQFTKLAAAMLLITPALANAAGPVVEVFKTATCGCCEAWQEHLTANGFTVKSTNVADPGDYRQKFGIPRELGSCHSARVGKYALEGHVPASDIKRLLASRAKARGLAVPGMPSTSPGMDAPRGQAYQVLLVGVDGRTSVYKQYPAKP